MLLLAWFVQQPQTLLHSLAMAQQDPLRAAFCGLVSSPQSLVRLAAIAPPELLAALKAKSKPSAGKTYCSLCASGHTPVFAGVPTSPLLALFSSGLPFVVSLAIGSTAPPRFAFQARGPPLF